MPALTFSGDALCGGRYGFKVFGHSIRYVWEDVFTTPVKVTTGRPCYDVARGFKINHQQTIASFFSKAFPVPVQVNLSHAHRGNGSSPFDKVSSASINVSQHQRATSLSISFMRTVRIPEDKNDYDLPPDLGRFPLFDVRPFSDKLPASMVAQGGLFLPMYRE
jgi:hypothetical protein